MSNRSIGTLASTAQATLGELRTGESFTIEGDANKFVRMKTDVVAPGEKIITIVLQGHFRGCSMPLKPNTVVVRQ